MNKVETSPEYLRAKLIDEPLVRLVFEHYWSNNDIDFILPTKEEDWEHADIIQVSKSNPLSKIYYDVKRNAPEGINTPNFLFSFRSNCGNDYEFKENGYIVYIDDATGDIIVINHMKMKLYVDRYYHVKSKRNNLSEYILIPKDVIRKDAYYIFRGTPQMKAYLANNRNYDIFKMLV